MNIVVLDVETTGKETQRDQIVELCIQRGLDAPRHTEVWRIKPSIPIHPEATEVHGIKAEDLEGCASFREHASAIVEFLTDAEVIVGYNVAFDLDMLQAELERAGLPRLDLSSKLIVDVLRLWHHVEPRTLGAAHEKFCGVSLDISHAASADVAATGRVLMAMLNAFGLAARAWPEIAAIANPFERRAKWLGPSPHFQWDGEVAVISFGKHRGTPLRDLEGGFLRWVIGKDFPPHVKDICRAALDKTNTELDEWLAKHFPRAT